MAWRVVMEDGPLAGYEGALQPLDDEAADWPEAFPPGEGGRYVLASKEPVPFAMGEHPNLLLTARYRWEAHDA